MQKEKQTSLCLLFPDDPSTTNAVQCIWGDKLLLTKYIYGKLYLYREHVGWKEVSHAGSEGGLAKPPCEVLSFCW